MAAAAVLARPAGASPLQATPEQHPATQDVYWDGQAFDAGGAFLNLGDWPGQWQDMQHQNLIDQFQTDFNCTVQYDSSWPWFLKFAAGGPRNPPLDVTNWNMPEMFKTARTGDYFVPLDELKGNVQVRGQEIRVSTLCVRSPALVDGQRAAPTVPPCLGQHTADVLVALRAEAAT